MGKVVKLRPKQTTQLKDPWCSPLILNDGTQISGGAAREKRLKAVGGVHKLLQDTLDNATRLAAGQPKAV